MTLQSTSKAVLTIAAAACAFLPVSTATTALAATTPGSQEVECISASTIPARDFGSFTFNHHPERHHKPKPTENFKPAEIVTEFHGRIARLPNRCTHDFQRQIFVKTQFKSTGHKQWRSQRRTWHRLMVSSIYISGEGRAPESPFGAFADHQVINAVKLGCATAARVRLKIDVIDKSNGAIVAIRYLTFPSQIDSWYQSRCFGRFSIHHLRLRECNGKVPARQSEGRIALWSIETRRIGCPAARKVALSAIAAPSFSEGSYAAQRIRGWRCLYSHRGALSCLQGSRRVDVRAVRAGSIRALVKKCGGRRLGLGVEFAVRAPCQAAAKLSSTLSREGPRGRAVKASAWGKPWSCAALRKLGPDDRVHDYYNCYSGASLVVVDISESDDRLRPSYPSTIAPDVKLPPAGLIGFPQPPAMKFEYGIIRRKRGVYVHLKVGSQLVRRTASLTIETERLNCEWTDALQVPLCHPGKRVGKTITKQIRLKRRQLVRLGPFRHHGNWGFRVRATTMPFSRGPISYTKGVAERHAKYVNEASHCSRSPFCQHGN